MSNTSKVGHHISSTTHLKSKQLKFHLKQNPFHLYMYFRLKFCPSKTYRPQSYRTIYRDKWTIYRTIWFLIVQLGSVVLIGMHWAIRAINRDKSGDLKTLVWYADASCLCILSLLSLLPASGLITSAYIVVGFAASAARRFFEVRS
jgi:hypothetical protein